MELNIHGKQMDVGEALRTHVTEKIEGLSSKYFNHTTYATVTFSKEGHGHARTKVHISIQLGKNIMVVADSIDPDPYGAFDGAATKAGKQLRRYKKKLRDHHARQEQTPEMEIMKARDYVLAMNMAQDNEAPGDVSTKEDSSDDGVPLGEDPVIIAEIPTQIESMSVSDAVMRMDLADAPVFVFRNPKHGGVNVVYRRSDGNVGWVETEQKK